MANKNAIPPPPGPGRPAGGKNRLTIQLEEIGKVSSQAIITTFKTLQTTKGKSLTAWAKQNTDLFYTRVFTKLIPQARQPDEAPRQVAIFINTPPPEQWTKPYNVAPEDYTQPQIPVFVCNDQDILDPAAAIMAPDPGPEEPGEEGNNEE